MKPNQAWCERSRPTEGLDVIWTIVMYSVRTDSI